MKLTKLFSVTAMEHLPWVSRAPAGDAAAASLAVTLTYSIHAAARVPVAAGVAYGGP